MTQSQQSEQKQKALCVQVVAQFCEVPSVPVNRKVALKSCWSNSGAPGKPLALQSVWIWIRNKPPLIFTWSSEDPKASADCCWDWGASRWESPALTSSPMLKYKWKTPALLPKFPQAPTVPPVRPSNCEPEIAAQIQSIICQNYTSRKGKGKTRTDI